MKYVRGGVVGGVIMLFFYAFLTGISPVAENSVIPTANVVADPQSQQAYFSNLPKSTVAFLTLELVGIVLGVIGHKILSDAQSDADARAE